MKTKIFAVACLATLLFTSCSKDNNDDPNPKPETTQVKHFETLMPGYDSWIYIDLETGKFEQQAELGEREYRKYKSMMGTEYEVIKKEPAKRVQMPTFQRSGTLLSTLLMHASTTVKC